jgi:hypothetical protein
MLKYCSIKGDRDNSSSPLIFLFKLALAAGQMFNLILFPIFGRGNDTAKKARNYIIVRGFGIQPLGRGQIHISPE